MGSQPATKMQDAKPADTSADTAFISSCSSKKERFEIEIQTLVNHERLPGLCVTKDWKVYLHKRSILNFEIPHERLIIEYDKYVLSIEMSNTKGTSSGLHRGDWRIYAGIVDESKDKTRATWTDYGKANFSLEHLVFYVKHVMDVTGDYNWMTQNCQTFARRIASELGKEVKELNDGTKFGIGCAVAVSSLILIGSCGDDDD
mmetsp:Transcript_20882/g.33429  ORF Transcript_20882/g.33429 Transcript_20882/m.33429 type:complete len:202 (-) Transcript_20882:68-673(-)